MLTKTVVGVRRGFDRVLVHILRGFLSRNRFAQLSCACNGTDPDISARILTHAGYAISLAQLRTDYC